jgi:cytochrome c-L
MRLSKANLPGAAILALAAFAGRASGDEIVFLSALNNAPLEFKHRTDQTITPEVESFKTTGVNPYVGDADAIATGKADYDKLCASCHLKDGTGRIGPNLSDDEWKYARTGTEVGRFEIIYGGGAGAMQPFGRRIDQDEILKVMAYVDTLAAK